MSAQTSSGGEGSRPSAATQAVDILARFKKALLTGQQPRIEDFLPNWRETDHAALLRGLVTLEAAYRLRHAEQPTSEEYRARFLGQEMAIEEAFRHPAVTGETNPTPGHGTNVSTSGDDGATDRMPGLDTDAAPYNLAVDPDALRRFGDYELLESIARDELGVVYRARQLSVDRIVALKLIMSDELATEANVQQFYRDTRAIAALDHPGIVPIFDFGQHEGQYFVSTGYIEGETLARKRSGGGLGLREGVEVVRQAAETIAYAHSKAVVHRNLTPKNILLNARGRPKLRDFRSATPAPAEGPQTMTGRVVGTPSYLAPEQAREGQVIGPPADIHALGAVLYFVLTGQPPFRGSNLVETLLQVLHRDPKSPRRLNPRVTAELEAICLKCLRKRPQQRYATAAELAEDLGRWLRNEIPMVQQESPIIRSARLVGQVVRTRPRVAFGVAGVAGAILVGVLTLAFLPRPAPKPEPPPEVKAAVQPASESRGQRGGDSIVATGKDATVLVEVETDGRRDFGSAFCIEASGLFVTAAHVVAQADKARTATIRLASAGGDNRRKVVPARVVRSDAGLDLAVLKVDSTADLRSARLELGHDTGLVESAVVTAFGYPLVTGAVPQRGPFPSVNANSGRIRSLLKNEGGLSRIQLDTALKPSDAGGPVLDAEGKVIGVVAANLRGATSTNDAIPVDQLNRFLAAPDVIFNPPPIPQEDRARPVAWMIEVGPPIVGPLPPDAAVTVRLRSGTTSREAVVKQVREGRYQAEVVPIADGPIELKVTVNGETFEGRAADHEVKVGGTPYALSQLSDLRRVDAGPRFQVVTAAGAELIEPVEGLGPVELRKADQRKPLDLRRASAIEVRPQAPDTIEAIVEVRQGATLLATARRELALVESQRVARKPDAPKPNQASVPVAVQPAAGGNTQVNPVPAVIDLPGEIDDLAVGSDRYLVLSIQSPAKVLVFDATTAAIVKEIPLTERALVAAGSKSFVIVYPEQGVFQNWDFATMTMKKEENLFGASAKVHIQGIAMGSQTEGPLLVAWDVDPPSNNVNVQNAFSPSDPRLRAVLIDPDSLKPIKIADYIRGGPQAYNGPSLWSKAKGWFVPNPQFVRYPHMANMWFQVRASARGDLFTIMTWHSSALIAMRESRSSRVVQCFTRFGGEQLLLPVSDGRRAVLGNQRMVRLDAGGAVDKQGDLPGRVPTPAGWGTLYPTEDPAYFLVVDVLHPAMANVVSVLLPNSELLVKQSFEDTREPGRMPVQLGIDNRHRVTGKRVLLFPEHELLVAVAAGNSRLLPRRIALRDALKRLNHPVVVSPTDVFATHGQTFSHQLRVLSPAGGVTYSVGKNFAPANLTVSPDGKVSWPVPLKSAGKEEVAVIRVKDATGQEVSHRLSILVR
jgi:S1-C subfamily serine protease